MASDILDSRHRICFTDYKWGYSIMQRNIQSIVVIAILFIAMIVTSGCMSTSNKGSYGGAVGSIDKPNALQISSALP